MQQVATTRFTVRGGARHAGGVTVEVDGVLDAQSTTGFAYVMLDLVRDAEVRIDLRRCRFIDTTGIAALVSALRRLRAAGTLASVVDLNPLLRPALEAAGVNDFLVGTGEDRRQPVSA